MSKRPPAGLNLARTRALLDGARQAFDQITPVAPKPVTPIPTRTRTVRKQRTDVPKFFSFGRKAA